MKYKAPRRKLKSTSHNLGTDKMFLDMTPKSPINKEKKDDKLHFLQIKNWLQRSNTETSLTQWRKYLKVTSDKRLIGRIRKEFLQLNNKKTIKMTREIECIFHQ